jgi:hypothetical protein
MVELKLYVWTEFDPDYYPGLAFAIAENEVEARELVVGNLRDKPGEWGILEVHPINQKIAYSVFGGT